MNRMVVTANSSNDGKKKKSVRRICQKGADLLAAVPLAMVRPAFLAEIRKEYPDLSLDGVICKDDLNRYRIRYLESIFSSEQGELSNLDKDVVLLTRAFDPYPYILLNLILSCLAAIQAPVIMMSQNCQEAKDRLRSEHKCRVNLKAELEIRHLHDTVDHLLSRQWERLSEIQAIQLELIAEVASLKNKNN